MSTGLRASRPIPKQSRMAQTSPSPSPSLPVAVSIAGSDSGGGAGIQADLLTFAAHDVFGTTAITCLTAQNPDGVSAVEALPSAFVRAQLDQLASYFPLGAAKTGMLFSSDIITAVAAFLDAQPNLPVVVDPVMVATSGALLLERKAVVAFSERLLPRATIITPNLDEAGVLLGTTPDSVAKMEDAVRELRARYQVPVLLKGGHLGGPELVDLFLDAEGELHRFTHERVEGVNTHGSGCTLAAALAARLARGEALADAVEGALGYLAQMLQRPLRVADETFLAHRPATG